MNIAVISGASSGMGREFVIQLDKQQDFDEIWVIARRKERLQELATLTKIVARYHEQDTWKTDLIFEEDSFDLLQNILEEAGQLETRAPYEELVNTDFAKEAAVEKTESK